MNPYMARCIEIMQAHGPARTRAGIMWGTVTLKAEEARILGENRVEILDENARWLRLKVALYADYTGVDLPLAEAPAGVWRGLMDLGLGEPWTPEKNIVTYLTAIHEMWPTSP